MASRRGKQTTLDTPQITVLIGDLLCIYERIGAMSGQNQNMSSRGGDPKDWAHI
jgi:hypothetical protein